MQHMHPDTIAQINPEMVEILSVKDLATFKLKMKAAATQMRKTDDSTLANRKVIYEFRKDNVMCMFTSDNDMVDSSTMYMPDFKSKKIYMFANPEVVRGENVHDTVIFDILHLSNDSLSLKFDPNSKASFQEDLKPMNFKVYKE